jgi:8-oxo-dGTP pyrophosphatase MutT (NUDIX family)
MSKIEYRTSYGIALCRYNTAHNNRTEVLMVKKRYTYQFFSFVFGYYKKYNGKYLKYLFDNMTFGEKIDILSMKFSSMWYRLWFCDPEKQYSLKTTYGDHASNNLNCYFRKKAKFDTVFIRDQGSRLKRLINNSSNATVPWEIPKGGISACETELDCAMREFTEETGVRPDKYTIIWNIPPVTVSHKDNNVVYRSVYYVAFLNKNVTWDPKVSFKTTNQLTEVEEVHWVSLQEIEFLKLATPLKMRLISTYKKIIKVFRAHLKSPYYTPPKALSKHKVI